MKKIKSLLVSLMMIVSLTLLVGCGAQEASAEGFQFTYKSKSEVTNENDTNYLKISLAVKNVKEEENTLTASKFTLKQGEETASTDAFIGNNIVDAMETETFDQMATLDLAITIALSDTLEGTYQLFYGETQLFEINAQKVTNNTANTDTNTNTDGTTDTNDPSLTA